MRAHSGGSVPVSVVVLNRDGRDDLLACLADLRALVHAPHRVVVVDNGSRDGSPEAVAAAHPEVELVRNAGNRGVAGGRNDGLRRLRSGDPGAFVLFLDNDTRLRPDCVDELVRATGRDALVGLVTPKAYGALSGGELVSAGGMTFEPATGIVRDVGAGEIDRGQYDRPHPVQACPGFAFLVRWGVFQRVGDFDEAFHPYGWEDVDFSLRARRAGFTCMYAPRAVVVHLGGKRGRGTSLERERAKAANLLRLMRRHATPLQWLSFAAVLPFRGALLAARELARGNGRFLPVTLAGAWSALRGPRSPA